MNLEVQWMTLFVMLATGVGMGLLFDSYRVVSEYFKTPKWSLSIMDMLYWIFSAIAVFRMLFLSNDGDLRGYVFIGLAIGVIMYAFMVSKPYSKFLLIIIEMIKRTIQAIIRLLDIVIVKPIMFLFKIVIICVKIGTKFTIRVIQIVLQLFIPILKVLIWTLKPLLTPIGRFVKKHAEQRLYPLLRRWDLLQHTIAKLSKWLAIIKKWIYS